MGFCLEICAKTYTELIGAMTVIREEMDNANKKGKVGGTLWELKEVSEVWKKEVD